MGKKEVKTNAMRILDRKKISYEYQTYECDEFTDGIETADKLNLPHEQVYKTIVTTGKSGEHYVFVLPIEAEIDFKKAAKISCRVCPNWNDGGGEACGRTDAALCGGGD